MHLIFYVRYITDLSTGTIHRHGRTTQFSSVLERSFPFRHTANVQASPAALCRLHETEEKQHDLSLETTYSTQPEV